MGISIQEIYLFTCDHCGIEEWFKWCCSDVDCRTLVRSKGWDIANEARIIPIPKSPFTRIVWHLHCPDCGPFCLEHDMFAKQLAQGQS